MLIFRLAIIAMSFAAFLSAQDNPALAAAKALDQAILKLNILPRDARAHAIHDLATRVRQQPPAFMAALVFNLSVDAGESDGREVLQDVANTMVQAIHESPPSYVSRDMYTNLASLARYGHVEVAIDDPKYVAAVSHLDADDRQRAAAVFTLQDIQGPVLGFDEPSRQSGAGELLEHRLPALPRGNARSGAALPAFSRTGPYSPGDFWRSGVRSSEIPGRAKAHLSSAH
jgi:hypothetical protein